MPENGTVMKADSPKKFPPFFWVFVIYAILWVLMHETGCHVR
jgi:hypothetical protein